MQNLSAEIRPDHLAAMADALSRANSLAGVMEEAGAGCTASETSFRDVLKHLPAPTEHVVAEVLGMVARTSGEGSKPWDIGVMVDGLKAANPALDWQRVVEHLDTPEFTIPDAASLQVLMSVWRRVSSEPFPLHAFVGGLWTNAAGQLSFLKQATIAPPEVLSWASAEHRQEPLEGLHAGKSSTGTPNKCWMCLHLYTSLAALADSGHSAAVRHILEHPLKGCPEVFLLGVASVKGGWGPLQEVSMGVAQW